jgi:hypothetical protein
MGAPQVQGGLSVRSLQDGWRLVHDVPIQHRHEIDRHPGGGDVVGQIVPWGTHLAIDTLRMTGLEMPKKPTRRTRLEIVLGVRLGLEDGATGKA